ncbi:hypothetical protein DVH24_039553 [Malus domestica]|uniref:Uncharacterized protein n=1 Tax=Malus domestica TaxID=3750 RepID=A0A498I5V2_MALDO|nr:hypothetical protein DVH24_039553 [Malus domestica]
MEGDRIRCLKKLFRALIVVFTLLQCAVNPSLSLGFKNISSEGVVRCFEREREALLAFKQGLVDHYNVLSSWGTEEHKQDCCKWVGIHCSNRTNHVTQLHLGWDPLNESYSHQQKGDSWYINYFLQGKKMSPKLIELQRLKYLDLSWINFNGTRLPYFIGSLSNLRHLDLSSASFGGRFPSQVGNLTHLQYLDLGWNDFNSVENLKSWLPLLSSLTYLDLSSTNLSNVHDWLEIVSKLPKLTNLTLRWCGLPPPVIPSSTLFNINSSKSLAHVDLSGNQCTSLSIYLWLSNYNASLVFLCLDNSSLTGLIPSVIENLTSLVYLSLSHNKFDVVNPHSFSSLCSLQSLYLGNNSLSGQFSEFVQMLSTCHLLRQCRRLHFIERASTNHYLYKFSNFVLFIGHASRVTRFRSDKEHRIEGQIRISRSYPFLSRHHWVVKEKTRMYHVGYPSKQKKEPAEGSDCKLCEANRANSVPSSLESCPSKQESVSI